MSADPTPSSRAERATLLALAGLLAAGIALRVGLMVADGPAFLGFPDSFFYIGSARAALFDDVAHPAGYALFLRLAHGVSAQLSVAIALQHVLGVATALLWFGTVRRVAPAAWALVPAAVVLLAGPQLFLEHAPLSEPLFAFLVAGCLYCAARTLDERPLPWAALAGLAAAMAACVRSVGVPLPVVLGLWLVVVTPGSFGGRLRVGGVALLVSWLLLAGYVVAARQAIGPIGAGLTRVGGVNLYARVATFADCGHFTPPAGTLTLCDEHPRVDRPGPVWYALNPRSPGARRLANGFRPADDAALTSFARAAIVHQPFDYLSRLGRDVTRFWSSSIDHGRYQGDTYGTLAHYLAEGPRLGGPGGLGTWYATGRQRTRAGTLDALRSYERRTRLEGPVFMLLVLLVLAGLPLARGRRLALGVLLVAVTLLTLLGPVATAFFTARFVVPGYGPLAAAGAVGAATLWARAVAWRARRSGAPELPERVAA